MKTHLGAPRAIDDLLLYRISRLLSTAGGVVIRYCEGRFGITRREWRLMAVLGAHGAMGSSDLAARAQLDRPATSRGVTAMLAKKLIERTSRGGDARQILISLTPAGQAIYAEMFPLVQKVNRDLLAVLSEGELATLDAALQRMQVQAEEVVARAADVPKADRHRGHASRKSTR